MALTRTQLGFALLVQLVVVESLNVNSQARRAVVFGAAAALTPFEALASTSATIFGEGSSERCENGEGEACERLSDGNDLIKKLQAQSRANKEKNKQALQDMTYKQLGYSDFFDTVDQNLVQLPNGTYARLSMEEYVGLRKAGRIKPGSIDRLIGEDGSVATVGSAPAGVVVADGSSGQKTLSYDAFKAGLEAKKVEGVLFQPPSGRSALVLMKDDQLATIDFDKDWKRAEAARVLDKQGLPNNLKEFL